VRVFLAHAVKRAPHRGGTSRSRPRRRLPPAGAPPSPPPQRRLAAPAAGEHRRCAGLLPLHTSGWPRVERGRGPRRSPRGRSSRAGSGRWARLGAWSDEVADLGQKKRARPAAAGGTRASRLLPMKGERRADRDAGLVRRKREREREGGAFKPAARSPGTARVC
jgi:hypothetical protein